MLLLHTPLFQDLQVPNSHCGANTQDQGDNYEYIHSVNISEEQEEVSLKTAKLFKNGGTEPCDRKRNLGLMVNMCTSGRPATGSSCSPVNIPGSSLWTA